MAEPLGYGVVYKDEDYAGLLRRLAIMLVDLGVVIPTIFVGLLIDMTLYDNSNYDANHYGLYLSLFISYIYLTALKASKYGTFGQLLTKTRIETIYGTRPGQVTMTMRLLYWLFGPFNFLSDLGFILAIKERRSLRDCLSNTIVVRRSAKPIDTHVPIRVTRVYALGLNLMYESCNNAYL